MRSNTRIDRTNKTFGFMRVLDRSETDKRKYDVLWLCCNTKDTITAERVGWQVKLPELKCPVCQKKEKKQKAKPTAEPTANKEPEPTGIMIPGMGFYPFLAPPIRRFATASGNIHSRRPTHNPGDE